MNDKGKLVTSTVVELKEPLFHLFNNDERIERFDHMIMDVYEYGYKEMSYIPHDYADCKPVYDGTVNETCCFTQGQFDTDHSIRDRFIRMVTEYGDIACSVISDARSVGLDTSKLEEDFIQYRIDYEDLSRRGFHTIGSDSERANVVRHIDYLIHKGYNILYVNGLFEDSVLAKKIISVLTGISMERLKDGHLTDEEFEKIDNALREAREWPVNIETIPVNEGMESYLAHAVRVFNEETQKQPGRWVCVFDCGATTDEVIYAWKDAVIPTYPCVIVSD